MSDDLRARRLGDLLSDVATDVRLLVLETAGLAAAEARATASALAVASAGAAGGLLLALFGALTIVASLVLIAIALGLPAWAAALGVGMVLVVAGGLTLRVFLARMRRLHFDLRETRQSVGETLTWLKTQMGR